MIVIGIATTEERYPYALKTIESLKGQCDRIHLCINSDKRDKADNGKFEYLHNMFVDPDGYPVPEYFLTVDDDIIYPKNYVKDTVKAINEFKCIVTYHGRKLVGKGVNYYFDHVQFSCLREVDDNVKVDVAGTECCGFAIDYFCPSGISEDKRLYMSDLLFSLEAAKQYKQIKVLKHSKNYLKYQNIDEKLTIYYKESKDGTRQNRLADKIYTINYELA